MKVLGYVSLQQAVTVALALFLGSCLDWPFRVAGGGSGTEGENGQVVVGMVYLPDGKAASGAEIFLQRSDYLRDTALSNALPDPASTITNQYGIFRFDSLTAGTYTLEIRNGKGLASQVQFKVIKAIKRLELGAYTLHPVGVLKGKVDVISGSPSPAYIQIYGLNRLVRTDETGGFTIPNLPSGYLRIQSVSSDTGWAYEGPSLALIFPEEITYLPNIKAIASATEDLATWPHSRKIYLHTDSIGINGTLLDVPILVRLDSGNFDFTASDGKDIRFSDAKGKRIPYHIDQWEAARGFAALWTKVDTLLGKDTNQFITLYWGKRNAPDFSNGKSVFTSYAGVWHFSEMLDRAGDGTLHDASPSEFAGLAHELTSNHQGVVGAGFGFNGRSSIKVPADEALKPVRTLTLSTWVKLSSMGPWGAQLVSMGNNYLLWVSPDGNVNFSIYTDSTWNPNHDLNINPWNVCSTIGIDLRNTGWHLVSSTYDGTTMRIFVGGMEKASRLIGKPMTYIFGNDFLVGLSGTIPTDDSFYWKFLGSLDEVHVSDLTRSPEWIKLEYENQKAGSRMLEFR